jgi:hypothetical protein
MVQSSNTKLGINVNYKLDLKRQGLSSVHNEIYLYYDLPKDEFTIILGCVLK